MLGNFFSFTNPKTPGVLSRPKVVPNSYDVIAFVLLMTIFALIATGASGMNQTLENLQANPIELKLQDLPKYALYTTLRMFAAIAASLLFTFVVATVAAKSRKAERLIIPALDILQSVPVLGFLTFIVPLCMGFFPGYESGVELAAIFAIFTAQAWNMAFSFYQSLRTVPADLKDVSKQFCLNGWQKFWKLEVPFAMPGLVWNTMMSMSGSWFFIIASEAISIGNTRIYLPGVGSWLATAIDQKNIMAVVWAVMAMGVVIILYDQIIFRPVVAWSDKFSMSDTSSQLQAKSWVYDVLRRSNFLQIIMRPLHIMQELLLNVKIPAINIKPNIPSHVEREYQRVIDIAWYLLETIVLLACIFYIYEYLKVIASWPILWHVLWLGLITALRVFVLVMIASLVWVPIGVWVGLRPNMVAWVQPLAQFLAAFPANVLFPIFVVLIMRYKLDPDIWLSPLMILGTQWYIFFNVIAGASAFPNDLLEAAGVYQLRSWLWWRKVILPGIFPYYVTGALTASGGSWNASIVAEVVHWGPTRLEAEGLGSYITNATAAGDYHTITLGVAVMCLLVVFINRIFWRRLYEYSADRIRL